MMMRWLVCPFFMLAVGVRAWQGPAAQRLARAVRSARRAGRGAAEEAGADAIAATDALAAEDARLVAEARAATEAGDQAAARIALAELEDVRARAARPAFLARLSFGDPPDQRFPSASFGFVGSCVL